MESNPNPPGPMFGNVAGRQAREDEARVVREAEDAALIQRASAEAAQRRTDEAAHVERINVAEAKRAATEKRAAARADHNRMKIYTLSAKDPQEPPFYFRGTVTTFVIAARSEKEARRIAAGEHVGDMSGAWEDHKLSVCVELAPDKPGVIARDMGA